MEGYLTHMFKITTQRSVESTNTTWKVQNTVAVNTGGARILL